DEFVEVAGGLIRQGARFGADGLGEVGDDGGVDRVGFGEPADGAGEVADLARVDDRERQAGGGQAVRDHGLEAAGGFEHHELDGVRAQACDEDRDAFAVPRDGEGLPARPQVNVQLILGDIDTGEHRIPLPYLQMRARNAALATVRAERIHG